MAKIPPSSTAKQKSTPLAVKDRFDKNDPSDVVNFYSRFINPPDKFFVAPGRKNHLLENYLPGPGNISLLVAPAGIGKTTLIADFVFTFAYKHRYDAQTMGIIQVQDPLNDGAIIDMPLIEYGTFLGQRITQPPGAVLYVALEGKRQLQLLGAAYEKHIQDFIDMPAPEASPKKKKKAQFKFNRKMTLHEREHFHPIFTMTDHGLRLNVAKDINGKPTHDDVEVFRDVLKALALDGHPPRIIVFDTARMALDGEEDSSKEVSELLRTAADIARDFNCSVIFLHHPVKGKEYARGSGAWEGNSDCVWEMGGDAATGVKIHVKKLKGFALPPDIYFKINTHKTDFLDYDAPGEFLTSASIETLDKLPATKKKIDKENTELTAGEHATQSLLKNTPEKKHAARQLHRMNTLLDAWEKSGSERDAETQQPYITKSALMEFLIDKGVSPSTAKQSMKPAADPNNKAYIIGPLLAEGLIVAHEYGWRILPSDPDTGIAPTAPPEATPPEATPVNPRMLPPRKKKSIPRKG